MGEIPIFKCFCYLRAHLFNVEGYGEEGKVHCNFVFAEVSKAFVLHILFHLSEHGFGFDASSPSVFDAFFGCEPFGGFVFVVLESMVYFDYSSVSF